MAPSLAEVLGALETALAEQGLRWYLFGAQAVLLHGRARMTEDIDVTVFPPPEGASALLVCLDQAGFTPRFPLTEDFIHSTWVLPVQYEGVPIDVVLAASGLEELFYSRVDRVDIGGRSIPVLSAEDLVVTKILAGRPKDQEDALGVIMAGTLDLSHVRSLLGELEAGLDQSDLLPALQRLLAEARRRGH